MLNVSRSRFAAALASAAALSLTATPAMARHWHRHDRGIDGGDVLAGVLLIGGVAAIAAAASSKANRESREPEYRYPEDRAPDSGYPSDDDYRAWRNYRDGNGGYGESPARDDYRGTGDWRGAGSMDGAVDACVDELERADRTVDTVDGVDREGNGWRVEGRLRDGRPYSCTADPDGRIRRMAVDGHGVI